MAASVQKRCLPQLAFLSLEEQVHIAYKHVLDACRQELPMCRARVRVGKLNGTTCQSWLETLVADASPGMGVGLGDWR